MDDVSIHEVEARDEERAVTVQVLAFAADPAARWLFPEPRDHLTRFPGFVRGLGGRAFENGTAYATRDFGGAALWLPVGVEPDPEPLTRLFEDTLEGERRKDAYAVVGQMADWHPKEPHWYLAVLGVDPSRQGEGLGSALLRHTLALCDADGLPAYLESSNPANLSLYERHGFQVQGEIQSGASPKIYPMYRPAR